MGTFFCALNRNKKSLKLDLKKPEGRTIIETLISKSGYDVIIDGFRPGVTARLGVDYESLKDLTPRLIYASLPGYGKGSPKEFVAAHDMNLLALAGICSISGNDRTGPGMSGIQIDDLTAGMYLAIGILGALCHRARTGKGQQVEVSMADTAFALNGIYLAQAALDSKAPGFAQHPLSGAVISYNIYKTKDNRFLTVGAVEAKFWQKACDAFGLPELISEQFADAKDGDPAYDKLKARIAEKTLEQWLGIFKEVDACVEPVLDCLEALDHPHFKARNMIREVDHPAEGKITHIASPIFLSETPFEIRRHVPAQGEHTDQILTEAGYTQEQIDELKKQGVIG
jgi:crotonobetainyl-CoA:carnitine CoA-transferase CaiB-like acyl-CoA transferase